MNITNKNIQETLFVIGKTFKVLNERERKILCSRYGLEDGISRTLAEVAEIENVTKERIRQIITSALNKIELVLKYEE